MVADYFLDREVQEFFCKCWIKISFERFSAESFDLPCLASRVSGRQFVCGFELSDTLGALESFCQKMDERGIDVVDTGADFFKFLSG